MKKEIIVAGFGGQGILSLGKILAHAGLIEGKEVTWMPSYGPEQRGGTANVTVILSDDRISSPVLNSYDVVVVLNQPSLDRFENDVKPGGTIIYDSYGIRHTPTRKDINIYRIDAMDEAIEMGNARAFNMLVLGGILKVCPIVNTESIVNSLKESLAERLHKLIPENEKAKRRITIFEPGLSMFEGTMLSNLRLNPFQPAAIDGAPIDMQTRCEKITALINATLPTGDILPVIMDEALYAYLKDKVDDFEEEEMDQLPKYPLLEGALSVAKRILQNRGYEQRVTDSFVAALETRFKYLTRGKRGKILNEYISTSYTKLFNQNCVINLSKIPNAKDKALIMSMILLSLYEYRTSAYSYDEQYRKKAQANELMHLTVIEEAHNVLSKPSLAAEGSGNPQQVVADLFSNMLSEIRSLGEGFMIIDQVPTKLIPDVIKNTNYKICHRMAAIDDCAVMAQSLALRDDQKGIIPTLEQGNAIIAGDLDDAASWVKITKPSINL